MLQALTAACLALLALWSLLLFAQRTPRTWIYLGICFTAACSLLLEPAGAAGHDSRLILLLIVGQSGLTFFFWLLAFSIADERFRPRIAHWLVLAAKLILTGFTADPARPPTTGSEESILRALPAMVFSAALVGHGLFTVYRDISFDLVEERFRLRRNFLWFSGITLFIVIAARLAFQGELEQFYHLTRLGITLVFTLGLSTYALTIRSDLLDAPANAASPVKVDRELLAGLTRAMETDRIYREEGLTIRRLAERLEEPEYRIRRLINGGLGHRNFNEYLNRYRIQEACEILRDPARENVPVVRISMDLGYRSLSSFNEAFRNLTGTTPTAFRRQSAE